MGVGCEVAPETMRDYAGKVGLRPFEAHAIYMYIFHIYYMVINCDLSKKKCLTGI